MKHIGILFVLLFLFSCNRNNLEKQLINFSGTEIFFPESLQANQQGRDTLMILTHAPLKIVVWCDSIGCCSSCRIKRLLEWNEFGDVFEPIFIFSTKANEQHSIHNTLRTSGFKHPVYIDKGNFFRKNNPDIPSDARLHTFLLDENNKVILIGNPINNEMLWELYKEQISSQIK